jgi:hypothetical protein
VALSVLDLALIWLSSNLGMHMQVMKCQYREGSCRETLYLLAPDVYEPRTLLACMQC